MAAYNHNAIMADDLIGSGGCDLKGLHGAGAAGGKMRRIQLFDKNDEPAGSLMLDVASVEKEGMAGAAAAPAPSAPGHRVRVSRINRANIRGSFLISAFAVLDGKREYLGTEPVLSRWHVEGCMNCLKHLEAQAHFPLPTKFAAAAGAPHVQIEVEVKSRIGLFGGAPVGPARLAATTAPAAPPAFKVEIV